MATLAEGTNSAYVEILAENSSNETPSDVLPTTNTIKTSRKRKRIHSIFPDPQQQNQIFSPSPTENVSLKTISSSVGPSTSANNGQIESQSTGISTVSLEKVAETKDVHSQKSKGSYQPWNEKTIEHFSEALKQYGKDWESIKGYIAHKSKTGAKNLQQVRNFYYNTWKQLSSVLNLGEIDAPKEAKELFILVNYGEWRKRTKSFKIPQNMFAEKFGELVRKGMTSVKFRITSGKGGPKAGKWLKIKTPTCFALKKFMDEKRNSGAVQDEKTLQKSVLLELTPKYFGDRGYVLDCNQNPLIRFSLSLNTPAVEIFTFLQNKWIPPDLKRLKVQFNEDISAKLPSIVLYPDNDVVFRSVTISAKPPTTAATVFGLEHYFPTRKRDEEPLASTAVGDEIDGEKSELEPGNGQQVVTSLEIYSSADSNDAATTDDDGEPIEIDDNAFNASQNEELELAPEQSEPHPYAESPSVTLNPDIFRDGLSLSNCGGLTVGQLCLMANGASKLKFLYKIQTKLNTNADASPAWLCFLKLIRQDFSDYLHKKSVADTVPADQPATVSSRVLHSPSEDLLIAAAQSSLNTPSRSRKKIQKLAPASANHQFNIPAPPAQVVASESEAFFLQYQQMTRKPVVVTRRPTVPTNLAQSSAASVSSPTVAPAVIFGQLVNSQPPPPADVPDNQPKEKNPDTVVKETVTDFSMSSSSSLFGFSTLTSVKNNDAVVAATPADHSLPHFDLSFDSPMKSVSGSYQFNESSLPRDVRRSFEMMMHQDSLEYCKNFADLAGNLETPKKCRSPDR